jgi:hypothetical protein
MITVPDPGQGTAGLELAGATEGIATTKVEALETRSQGEAERGPVLLLREDPIEGKHGPGERRRSRGRDGWLERSRHLRE